MHLVISVFRVATVHLARHRLCLVRREHTVYLEQPTVQCVLLATSVRMQLLILSSVLRGHTLLAVLHHVLHVMQGICAMQGRSVPLLRLQNVVLVDIAILRALLPHVLLELMELWKVVRVSAMRVLLVMLDTRVKAMGQCERRERCVLLVTTAPKGLIHQLLVFAVHLVLRWVKVLLRLVNRAAGVCIARTTE